MLLFLNQWGSSQSVTSFQFKWHADSATQWSEWWHAQVVSGVNPSACAPQSADLHDLSITRPCRQDAISVQKQETLAFSPLRSSTNRPQTSPLAGMNLMAMSVDKRHQLLSAPDGSNSPEAPEEITEDSGTTLRQAADVLTATKIDWPMMEIEFEESNSWPHLASCTSHLLACWMSAFALC